MHSVLLGIITLLSMIGLVADLLFFSEAALGVGIIGAQAFTKVR